MQKRYARVIHYTTQSVNMDCFSSKACRQIWRVSSFSFYIPFITNEKETTAFHFLMNLCQFWFEICRFFWFSRPPPLSLYFTPFVYYYYACLFLTLSFLLTTWNSQILYTIFLVNIFNFIVTLHFKLNLYFLYKSSR